MLKLVQPAPVAHAHAHAHPLAATLRPDGFRCDGCAQTHPPGSTSSCCLPCDFDLCRTCAPIAPPAPEAGAPHPHPLTLLARREDWVCDVCRHDYGAGSSSCACEACNFDLCGRCVLLLRDGTLPGVAPPPSPAFEPSSAGFAPLPAGWRYASLVADGGGAPGWRRKLGMAHVSSGRTGYNVADGGGAGFLAPPYSIAVGMAHVSSGRSGYDVARGVDGTHGGAGAGTGGSGGKAPNASGGFRFG
jgi:hypothetical protein